MVANNIKVLNLLQVKERNTNNRNVKTNNLNNNTNSNNNDTKLEPFKIVLLKITRFNLQSDS